MNGPGPALFEWHVSQTVKDENYDSVPPSNLRRKCGPNARDRRKISPWCAPVTAHMLVVPLQNPTLSAVSSTSNFQALGTRKAKHATSVISSQSQNLTWKRRRKSSVAVAQAYSEDRYVVSELTETRTKDATQDARNRQSPHC
jgi:hypothetical protein